ncbi:hypothetical protein E2C01_071211 [Portunus trituberculatus]|uniref:Uncharacterized protein n=1 Tax=Portunus trituberculatus TaxID=210409 RepID=A0A5B7I4K0_PORTR|nr:hypothetical protein [Portunus trituberculatus]
MRFLPNGHLTASSRSLFPAIIPMTRWFLPVTASQLNIPHLSPVPSYPPIFRPKEFLPPDSSIKNFPTQNSPQLPNDIMFYPHSLPRPFAPLPTLCQPSEPWATPHVLQNLQSSSSTQSSPPSRAINTTNTNTTSAPDIKLSTPFPLPSTSLIPPTARTLGPTPEGVNQP